MRSPQIDAPIIGLDPGLSITGYAVLTVAGARLTPVSIGVLRTSPTRDPAARLNSLREALEEVLSRHRPGVAAVERLFFNSNVKTAMSVGQASGVLLATLGAAGIPAATYTPPEVKLAVAGTGTAPKSQVQSMVARLLKLAEVPSPPDAADACALAICHARRAPLKAAIAAAGART